MYNNNLPSKKYKDNKTNEKVLKKNFFLSFKTFNIFINYLSSYYKLDKGENNYV